MERLAWEHGRAPRLRNEILLRLQELSKTEANLGVFKIYMLLALRFRRMAADADTDLPRDYTYSVDVALPKADSHLIQDMLESRHPQAPIRYDIVRVCLYLPGTMRAAVHSVRPEETPMMLEMVSNSGAPLFASSPDDLANLVGTVDVVQDMVPSDLVGTPSAVISALVDGVNQLRKEWPLRPKMLFRVMALPMAVLGALDAEHSPCAIVARAYRLKTLRGVFPDQLVDYESCAEMSLPTVPLGQERGSVQLTVPQKTETGKVVFAQRVIIQDEIHINFPASQLVAVATYPLTELRVAGSAWREAEAIELSTKFDSDIIVTPATSNFDAAAVTQEIATILAGIRQGKMPVVGSVGFSWAHLGVVHMWPRLRDMFPAQVIDELMDTIVGQWAYNLMSGGYRGNNWKNFSFHFLTLTKSPSSTLLLERLSERAHLTRIVPTNALTWPRRKNPDYAVLLNAILMHLAPWFAEFS